MSQEVQRLSTRCSDNNLALNTAKTKEIIMDFRRNRTEPLPLYINGERLERAHTFRFLRVQIPYGLSWTHNTTAVIKKAQQCLHFLRVLRRNNMDSKLLLAFYRSYHWEPAHVLCLHLVRELHWGRQSEASEDSQSSTEDSWLSSPLPDEHLLHLVPQQILQRYQGQLTSQFSAVWAVAVW